MQQVCNVFFSRACNFKAKAAEAPARHPSIMRTKELAEWVADEGFSLKCKTCSRSEGLTTSNFCEFADRFSQFYAKKMWGRPGKVDAWECGACVATSGETDDVDQATSERGSQSARTT